MLKDKVMGKLQEHFKDNDSDETLQLIESISDLFEGEKENEDWKKKYDDLDKTWRKKYKDRFFQAQTTFKKTESEEYEEEEEFDTEEEIEKYRKENPKFEDIFKTKK